MKKIICLVGVVILVVAGCSSDDSNTCKDVCAKAAECDSSEDISDCESECTEMKGKIRPGAFSEAANCILTTDCSTLDMDTCLLEAATNVPNSVVDTLISEVCAKNVECEFSTLEQCTSEYEGDFYQGEAVMYKMFNDASLQCVSDCITGKTCEVLADESVDQYELCTTGCGLSFESDDS
jgi:hypothetical protein